MSAVNSAAPATRGVQVVRFFARFTRGQRWEHWLLFGSFTVLFLTGIVQKYRTEPWSQNILSTPERLAADPEHPSHRGDHLDTGSDLPSGARHLSCWPAARCRTPSSRTGRMSKTPGT